MALGLVDGFSMKEHPGMLAEVFTVVARDDHPSPLKNRPALELVQQLTELLIEISNAVVVSVASQSDLSLGRHVFLR
jgi:hypothetical protein